MAPRYWPVSAPPPAVPTTSRGRSARTSGGYAESTPPWNAQARSITSGTRSWRSWTPRNPVRERCTRVGRRRSATPKAGTTRTSCPSKARRSFGLETTWPAGLTQTNLRRPNVPMWPLLDPHQATAGLHPLRLLHRPPRIRLPRVVPADSSSTEFRRYQTGQSPDPHGTPLLPSPQRLRLASSAAGAPRHGDAPCTPTSPWSPSDGRSQPSPHAPALLFFCTPLPAPRNGSTGTDTSPFPFGSVAWSAPSSTASATTSSTSRCLTVVR
ncbi:hypothetical protein EES39_09165 [Streptomyces sp. ADI92-24]|nr:hypothetical protein EES39_09165 [Streptomyces sp. ADI92-24]